MTPPTEDTGDCATDKSGHVAARDEMDVRFILSDDFGTVSMPVPTEMRGDYDNPFKSSLSLFLELAKRSFLISILSRRILAKVKLLQKTFPSQFVASGTVISRVLPG